MMIVSYWPCFSAAFTSRDGQSEFLLLVLSIVNMPITFLLCTHAHSERDYSEEFDYFLRGKESLRLDNAIPEMNGLTKEQVSVTPSHRFFFFIVFFCVGEGGLGFL